METPTYVVSDLHGQAVKFGKAVEALGPDSHWVINGDRFDRGEQPRELLDIELSLPNRTSLLGNHEWAYLGGLTDADPVSRNVWQNALFSASRRARMEFNVLKSYGVSERYDPEGTALALKEKLEEFGHLALFQEAEVYYEDDDVFVIHAGVDSELSIAEIYRRLDVLRALHQAHRYDVDGVEPDEIFSFRFAHDLSTPRDLGKTLVTGHVHFNKSAEDRMLTPTGAQKPSRVQLASYLDKGNPLFVYDVLEQRIHSF